MIILPILTIPRIRTGWENGVLELGIAWVRLLLLPKVDTCTQTGNLAKHFLCLFSTPRRHKAQRNFQVSCVQVLAKTRGELSVNFYFNPFTPKSDQCQFLLTINIKSHPMKNLAFQSLLRWKIIILPNSFYLTHTFLFEKVRRRMHFFELGSERVDNRRHCESPIAVK